MIEWMNEWKKNHFKDKTVMEIQAGSPQGFNMKNQS